MIDPKRYEKAMNAARSVVRGSRKQAVGAVSSLALLLATPGCGTSSETPTPDTQVPDTQALEDIGNDIAADIILADTAVPRIPDSQNDSGVAADTKVNEDTSVADTTPEPDTAITDTAIADTAVADTTPPCISSCYQPNGMACEAHEDCNIEEPIPGTCGDTDKTCTPAEPCDPGVECEGYKGTAYAQLSPDGKEASPWSPVQCIEGECHEGQMLNAKADECCSIGWENMCPDAEFMAGCTPWGPAAPPAFRAELAKLLWQEVV